MSTQAPITRTGLTNRLDSIYAATPTKRTRTVSKVLLILLLRFLRHQPETPLWKLLNFIAIINIIVKIYSPRRAKASQMAPLFSLECLQIKAILSKAATIQLFKSRVSHESNSISSPGACDSGVWPVEVGESRTDLYRKTAG